MNGTTDVMDRLGDDLREIFDSGMATLLELAKRAVLHGLETKRIGILWEIQYGHDRAASSAVQRSRFGCEVRTECNSIHPHQQGRVQTAAAGIVGAN